MNIKNIAIVATICALISACASDPDGCKDDGHNHGFNPNSIAQQGKYVQVNDSGYENLFKRYRSLETIFYFPSFYIVEGSYLVGLSPAHDGIFTRNQPYDNWLFVQLGEHYKACDGEYQSCLTHDELFKYYEATNSHRLSHDSHSYNLTNHLGVKSIYPGDEQVFFDFDSSALDVEALTTLASVKRYLAKYPTRVLLIVGRADATGKKGYNWGLSKRRAMSVYHDLINRGIPKDRIKVAWKGEGGSGYGRGFRIAELNYD
ncbi:OmpA family protein [Photobacterium angustum]|uniref:OmpA family protein n=1 Tax=Photobacterium angustum TaxID=661 RepID=A0ABX5H1R4_PHOAN|nr:OmpA family protein [Photobacterium angustum]PSX07066.1 OmpA family protein [Photobacterium angustum]